MTFDLQVLGTAAATPSQSRHPSSQVLSVNNENYLIDCGEGTQMRLKTLDVKIFRINNIFISHLHGDHYLGLMGLLLTMNLFGRTKTLNLFCPRGLAEIITLQLKYSDTVLDFDIALTEINPAQGEMIFEDEYLTVTSFPLYHRVPTCGFTFYEKPKAYNLIKEKLPADIKKQDLVKLKKGEDVKDKNGNIRFAFRDYTYPPKKRRKFAYCSDTEMSRSVIPFVQQADILFHEATFLDELHERAKYTMHSTAYQAACIARDAGVKQLLIGHFSSRYKDATPLIEEARAVFPDTYEAIEGTHYEVFA